MANSDKLDPKVLQEIETFNVEEISPLRKYRGIHKRKIALKLKTLTQQFNDEELTPLYRLNLKDINSEKDSIKNYDEEINKVMCQYDFENLATEYYDLELEDQANYLKLMFRWMFLKIL